MTFTIIKKTFCKIIEQDGYQILVQKEYDSETDEDVVTITQQAGIGSMVRKLSGFSSTEARDKAFDNVDEKFLQDEIEKATN